MTMSRNQKPYKVLIIDDSADLSGAFSDIMHSFFGCRAKVALSCEAAMEFLEREDFHFIIADLYVASRSVLPILSRLRHRGIKTPFIFFTSHNTDSITHDPKEYGFEIVRKPHMFMLIDRLSVLFENSN